MFFFCQHKCALCVYVNWEPPIHWFAALNICIDLWLAWRIIFFMSWMTISYFLCCCIVHWNCLNGNKAKPMSWESWTLFLLCLTVVFQLWWSQQVGAGRREKRVNCNVTPLDPVILLMAIMLLSPLKGIKVYWSWLPWWRYIVLPLYITVFCSLV